jgi:type I restriction enzyme R subunit
VDYRGLLGNLDEALTTYACLEGFDENDITGAVIDVKQEIEKAKTYYTHLETLFADVEFKNDMESYEVFLAEEEKRELFKEYLSEFAKAFKLALTSDKLEEVLTEEEILIYKKKIKFYKVDFGKYEEQMQKLLDTFISANEVNELTKLVNVFDTEFDDEVNRVEGKNAKADTILSAVSAVAKEKMESNPAFYKSLAQQIQDIIDAYREKRLSEEEKYEKAEKLKKLLLNDEEKKEGSYPDSFRNNKVVKAIYDNLTDILSSVETIDTEKISENLALEFDKIYKQHSLKPEWDKNKDVENEITSDMEDCIWDIEDEYEINIEDKKKIYQVIRGIGISFYG